MAQTKPGQGRYKVVGHVAVVKVADGSERYLYRGATFDAAQVDADRVKHLLGVGLIQKLAEPSVAEKAAKEKAEADAKASAEKAAAGGK
ncbi:MULTISPECIES: hypothetical protein [Bacteria]|uniref:Uncharacterized protein n=1 Tax=Microbacterium phage Min1 TaxID=446529 RepID=A6N201_9CAUD|nr:hypothetical protein MPMin1_gp43 [Microbacterium phage Min1]ABR10473.1 hypothetical protein [Microbacterium phage Min1]